MWPFIIVLEVIMATRRRGQEKPNRSPTRGFSTVYSNRSYIHADLENIHTRRGSTLVIPLRLDQRLGIGPKGEGGRSA